MGGKAEADFTSAQREFRARKQPNYDAACFFAQQSLEKYIKALLQEAEIEFGKLLDLVSPAEPLWEPYRAAFRPISAYAVDYRYPGETASKDEAAEALRICRKFRKVARDSLQLPD